MSRFGLYWHTVRHLRPVQVFGRLRYRVARPNPDLRPAPPLRVPDRGAWVIPAHRPASMTGPRELNLLNVPRTIDASSWNDAAIEKLWLYNLHYFDDLNAEVAYQRDAWHLQLIADWLANNPPAVGAGWEAYPTSLRIVNWIKWVLGGATPTDEQIHSLAVQARWLSRRLETHLLGNHLLANAKALIFAGLFFSGEEAARWLNTGLQILSREIGEQFLPDGGQFELSTMYHVLAVEDLLDLANVCGAYAVHMSERQRQAAESWRPVIERARRWLAIMCHPDTEISFFNDAAFGIAPPRREIIRYSRDLGFGAPFSIDVPLLRLPDSGYLRVQTGDAVAVLDVAAVGPDYLPAHAHADTLSFELSLFGRRVLVNSGTSRYGGGAERLRERGTAAHNTVVVNGADSSEVWGGFRVARRARADLLEAAGDGTSVVVRARHDGYTRLRGRPRHTRTWTFAGNSLEVSDRVAGSFETAEARYHVHPSIDIDAASASTGSIRLTIPERGHVTLEATGGRLSVEPSSWHPEFGVSVPNACIVVRFSGAEIRTRLTWESISAS